MSMGMLLNIEPAELRFPFEPKKQSSCSLQLSNKTNNHVAVKVKTTNPKKYCVRPNLVVVLPRSTCDVIVSMQAQKEAPPDLQCKDKFLIQSVKTNDGTTAKDITAEMFNKKAGHVVEECKLKVVYVSPPPPSSFPKGSEGSLQRGSVSDNGNVIAATLTNVVEECKLKVVYVSPPKPPSPFPKGSFPKGSVSDNGNVIAAALTSATKAFAKWFGPKKRSAKGKVQDVEDSWQRGNRIAPQKIFALEDALVKTKMQIEALETALADTKMVMEGLMQQIEELRN